MGYYIDQKEDITYAKTHIHIVQLYPHIIVYSLISFLISSLFGTLINVPSFMVQCSCTKDNV